MHMVNVNVPDKGSPSTKIIKIYGMCHTNVHRYMTYFHPDFMPVVSASVLSRPLISILCANNILPGFSPENLRGGNPVSPIFMSVS